MSYVNSKWLREHGFSSAQINDLLSRDDDWGDELLDTDDDDCLSGVSYECEQATDIDDSTQPKTRNQAPKPVNHDKAVTRLGPEE